MALGYVALALGIVVLHVAVGALTYGYLDGWFDRS